MSPFLLSSILFAFLVAVDANTVSRVAVALLTPRGPGPTVTGRVVFTETDDGLHVTGSIVGLPAGKYGFHVHELGDIESCDNSGGHFNPENTNHGGRNHTVRHVGDLGNVVFESIDVSNTSVATLDITDHMLTLRDRNNILGRTLVLHEQEDDLGQGGDEGSLATGNAGARVACGVIGIYSPREPWNAAVITSPSLLLFIVTAFCFSFMK